MTTDLLDLSGRRALVTGASRGIGAAIARELALRGAHVWLNFSRDEPGALATLSAIEASGGHGALVRGNLVDPEAIRQVFDRIAADGGLDIFVHNAAIGSFKDSSKVRANQWDLTLSVNSRALLLGAQHALPLMQQRGGGHIVAVSSLGAGRVVPRYGAIGISKAALEATVRYLAVELAPAGVFVNAVSAGPIDTAALRLHPGREEMLKRAEQAPAGRRTPEDVARIVLFLCSPLAAGIVGQTILVDGGLSLTI
jgi:enoyl-[acyl-carrier protein] reductase III